MLVSTRLQRSSAPLRVPGLPGCPEPLHCLPLAPLALQPAPRRVVSTPHLASSHSPGRLLATGAPAPWSHTGVQCSNLAGLCAHNPSDDTQPRQLRWLWWVGGTASPSGVPVSSGLTPSRGGRLHWRERRDLVGFGKTISENFCFMWEIGINLILCCILYLSCV